MPSIRDTAIRAGDILVVDDETSNLRLLTGILARGGFQVRQAEEPQLAIESALARPPDLILLDVMMPEMDGFEVCRCLKQDERTRNIPIIFVSALHDEQNRVRGFEAGGVDFISKPFQELEILARARTHIDLRAMRLRLEELVAERTAELESEIAERRQAEEELQMSETNLVKAQEVAHIGSWNLDLLENNLSWTDENYRIFGVPEGTPMTYERFLEVVHPEDRDYVDRKWSAAIKGEPYDIEHRLLVDNEVRWVREKAELTFDDEGRRG
jgi:DNA-binding response OmpR family regulator